MAHTHDHEHEYDRDHEHEYDHDHEHEYDHDHDHEYDHDHEHTHSHSHAHGHDHAHDHDHTHTHPHDHTHTGDTPSDLQKTKALLTYMVQHNEHHAEELADLLPALPEKARERLLLAIGTFESANTELRVVLDELE